MARARLFTGGDNTRAHCHLVPVVGETDIASARYIVEKNLTCKPLPHPGDAELAKIATSLSKELEVVLCGASMVPLHCPLPEAVSKLSKTISNLGNSDVLYCRLSWIWSD